MTEENKSNLRLRLEQTQIWLAGFFGTMLLRLLCASLRWEEWGLDGDNKNWGDGEPRIVAFWHSRQLLMPWIYLRHCTPASKRQINVLISQHNDGRIVAKVMSFLRIGSVAGSSSRGGREALFALIHKLQNGEHIAITPDGPRGPACKMKPGVVRIAQRSGAKIYPIALSADRVWRFRSWDRMILPKPFARALLAMGEPFTVPSELSNEAAQQLSDKIEAALNALTAKADQHFESLQK